MATRKPAKKKPDFEINGKSSTEVVIKRNGSSETYEFTVYKNSEIGVTLDCGEEKRFSADQAAALARVLNRMVRWARE